jgi:hypothetical protein
MVLISPPTVGEMAGVFDAARVGVAWAEAEAALPPETGLQLLTAGTDAPPSDVGYIASAATWGERFGFERAGHGPTPVAALLALAVKLRETI